MSRFRHSNTRHVRQGVPPSGTTTVADQRPAAPAPPVERPAAPTYNPGVAPPTNGADGDVHALWEARTRVFLQPLAPPSIIGLLGFMGATLMVGAWQAGW